MTDNNHIVLIEPNEEFPEDEEEYGFTIFHHNCHFTFDSHGYWRYQCGIEMELDNAGPEIFDDCFKHSGYGWYLAKHWVETINTPGVWNEVTSGIDMRKLSDLVYI